MESRSIRSLENMSLAPRMTRGNGLWTKWMLFFLSIAISERKRQNKHKEIKRGTNAPFQIPWISNSMNLMKFKFHESQIPWISNSMNLKFHESQIPWISWNSNPWISNSMNFKFHESFMSCTASRAGESTKQILQIYSSVPAFQRNYSWSKAVIAISWCFQYLHQECYRF